MESEGEWGREGNVKTLPVIPRQGEFESRRINLKGEVSLREECKQERVKNKMNNNNKIWE